MRTVPLLLLLVLGACSNKGLYHVNLMPAPEIYSDVKVDPFSDEASRETLAYDGILYATDRLPANEKDKEAFYENKRGHALRLGIAKIRLGEADLNWEEAKRISLLKNRGRDYPLYVAGTDELGLLSSSRSTLFESADIIGEKTADEEFAAFVDKKLAESKTRDVFVYVPGFKVVFSNPLLVATELWHFLGYDGAFVAYSWPATPSNLAYFKDLETVVYSSRNLRLLLEYLANHTHARRIHLIAYSAGTRLALNALGQLALLHAGDSRQDIARKLRIGNVILVGSDVDRDVFAGLLEDGLLNVVDRLTVYQSATDQPLGVARFVFRRQRLGEAFQPGKLAPAVSDFLRHTSKLVVIDVTDAEAAATDNGHAYFRKSPWVSSDVLMTLKYDLSPEQRGLVPHSTQPIWAFPKDYTRRLRIELDKVIGPGPPPGTKK